MSGKSTSGGECVGIKDLYMAGGGTSRVGEVTAFLIWREVDKAKGVGWSVFDDMEKLKRL